MHRQLSVIVVAIGIVVSPLPAHAAAVLFSSSGPGVNVGGSVTLSANALFDIDGTTLKVRLRNGGDNAGTRPDVPGNSLTGVFFDLPTGVSLTPVKARVAMGKIIQPDECDVPNCATETNVGGEFIYQNQAASWSGHLGNHGIASSGYISGPAGNFNGPDLDAPAAPNGPNFGIQAPLATHPFNPNGGLESVPLIDEEVVFTMAITKNGVGYDGLLLSQISNVSFQYGTNLSEPKLPPGLTPSQTIPEPALILLLGPAVLAFARRRARQR